MSIDYEAEYNNRAQVPEHPEDLRALARGRGLPRAGHEGTACRLGLSYGESPRQFIDLFAANAPAPPLALFIHGGYWRSLEPSLFSHMARGLNERGVSVAVTGYDLRRTCRSPTSSSRSATPAYSCGCAPDSA